MKNFEITSKEDDKRYWISRSVTVSVFIFIKANDGEIYILSNKRGEGAMDYQGYWNCPCGYLDFDETGEECAVREVFEETGYRIDKERLHFEIVKTDPKENRQNVNLQYYALIEEDDLEIGEREGGEIDEVSEVKLINIKEVDKYQWAFNHLNNIYYYIMRDNLLKN